jgi:hypothetical protein
MKKGYVLGAILIASMIFAATTAAQTNVVTTTLTFQAPSNSVWDACTQEFVDFTGSMQIVTDFWYDANGAKHIRGRMPQINVKGTGETTHLDYVVLAGGGLVEMITTNNMPFVETFVFHTNLNGAGPAPNEEMFTLFKITVNANGTTAAEVDTAGNPTSPHFDPKCSGK